MVQNPVFWNSIQFKALFRIDINHTYNTSSNELLKSTMAELSKSPSCLVRQ
jgi:hypothetical protein